MLCRLIFITRPDAAIICCELFFCLDCDVAVRVRSKMDLRLCILQLRSVISTSCIRAGLRRQSDVLNLGNW